MPRLTSDKALELVATILLGLTAVATAWSGYQSSLWNGQQAEAYGRAASLRASATAATTHAGQDVLHDVINFNAWSEATLSGDERRAQFYERRFRPEFHVAFDDWLNTNPFGEGERGSAFNTAPPSPTFMPSYHLANQELADRLTAQADKAFAEGQDANKWSDYFVLVTVLLALALFFSALVGTVDWIKVRIGMLAIATVILVLGTIVSVFVLPNTHIG